MSEKKFNTVKKKAYQISMRLPMYNAITTYIIPQLNRAASIKLVEFGGNSVFLKHQLILENIDTVR